MRLRILPVAILALVLALGVKLGGVWTGAVDGGISPSLAQQAPASPAKTDDAVKDVVQEPKKAGAAAPRAPAKDAKKTSADAAKSANALPDDPALFTQAEIDLLQKLSARRAQLDKWSQELEMREGLLKAAEQRIDRKVGELRQIQAKIQGMLKQYDKEQEDKLKSLVKIYETMKPKEAARVFMELDMPVLLDVVERMKEARSAAIISRLEPDKAKKLTVELAKRRKIGVDAKGKLPVSAEALPSSTTTATPAQGG